MQIESAPSIRIVFDQQANLIEELDARRREDMRRRAFEAMERDDAHQERVRRDEKDRKDQAEFLDHLRETERADSKRIAEFTAQLDRYDAMTVEALQENERQTAELRKRIEAMLADAAQLPDGRHVFKAKDGTQVFDEHGAAVSPDEIRPEEIADSKPSAEAYQADLLSQDALARKREGLLAFQQHLDTARETLGKDGLTNGDLDALEDDIDAAMPSGLREAQENAPGRTRSETDPAVQWCDAIADTNAVSVGRSAAPRPGI